MRLQCTKNLQTYLKLDGKSLEPLPEDYEAKYDSYGFHANVKKIGGRNVFIFMNNKTRYSLIFMGRFPKKPEDIKKLLQESLLEEMETEGILPEDVTRFLDGMGTVTFSKTSDRQLVGCMNELAFELEYTNPDEWEKDIKFQLAISQFANDTFKKLDKNYIVPREELYKEMEELRADATNTMEPISDLQAVKRWKSISQENRKLLEGSVFCSNCGCTTIKPGYVIKSLTQGDILITGKCYKCNGQVARVVEHNWD